MDFTYSGDIHLILEYALQVISKIVIVSTPQVSLD